jgi:hypothetical protein
MEGSAVNASNADLASTELVKRKIAPAVLQHKDATW